MALEKSDEDLKRYYSISEVAKRFDLKPSVIRFWEGEFDFLKPHKNAKGDRRFTKANIEQLRLIHHLLKERGFTIEGARKEISSSKKALEEKVALLDRLRKIRSSLSSILED